MSFFNNTISQSDGAFMDYSTLSSTTSKGCPTYRKRRYDSRETEVGSNKAIFQSVIKKRRWDNKIDLIEQKINFFSLLPDELLIHIIEQLPTESVLNPLLVDRRWFAICHDRQVVDKVIRYLEIKKFLNFNTEDLLFQVQQQIRDRFKKAKAFSGFVEYYSHSVENFGKNSLSLVIALKNWCDLCNLEIFLSHVDKSNDLINNDEYRQMDMEEKFNYMRCKLRTFTHLTSLNLSNKGLNELPAEIGLFTELSELCLSYNALTTLPSEIGNLKKLERLLLAHNNLTSIPLEIGKLVSLKVLLISYNRLSDLPSAMNKLVNLQTLCMNGNQFIKLPKVNCYHQLKCFEVDEILLDGIELFRYNDQLNSQLAITSDNL